MPDVPGTYQIIQLKRRIGAPGIPDSLYPGEPAVTIDDGRADLVIGDGAEIYNLVSPERQVEITGDQTITGTKTFNSIKITGGNANGMLQTDGSGNVSFTDFATSGQIATGTDTSHPINSAGLRTQLGADAATLVTDTKTVVPAINELRDLIAALSGAVRLVGTYDAAGNEVAPVAGSPATAGALPAASAANEGWYVIVDEGGTGTGNAPHVSIEAGDWLVSTGYTWAHIAMHRATMAAGNIVVNTIDAQSWVNVQEALQGLYARTELGAIGVVVDDVSIAGDGTTADPLHVHIVDGGEF